MFLTDWLKDAACQSRECWSNFTRKRTVKLATVRVQEVTYTWDRVTWHLDWLPIGQVSCNWAVNQTRTAEKLPCKYTLFWFSCRGRCHILQSAIHVSMLHYQPFTSLCFIMLWLQCSSQSAQVAQLSLTNPRDALQNRGVRKGGGSLSGQISGGMEVVHQRLSASKD